MVGRPIHQAGATSGVGDLAHVPVTGLGEATGVGVLTALSSFC